MAKLEICPATQRISHHSRLVFWPEWLWFLFFTTSLSDKDLRHHTIVITMPAVRHVNNKSVSIEHLKTSLFSICMVHLERLSKMTTVGSMNSCYEFGPLFLATKGVALLIAFSSNARVTIKSTICKASVICSGLFVSIFTRCFFSAGAVGFLCFFFDFIHFLTWPTLPHCAAGWP